MTIRTVAKVKLVSVGPGRWHSADGRFEFFAESGSRTRLGRKGWAVRALTGDFADPDGRYEPLMLANGLSWADTLRDAVYYVYQGKDSP